MQYLSLMLPVLAGLVVLVIVLVRVFGAVKRTGRAQARFQGTVRDRTGLLRARSAALRVAIMERRASTKDDMPAPRTIG
ncbi:bacteriophage holin [Crossiella sp. CA-258035]|uniref:bacteriophage holin n=1 Tax=Crossiella sp. CA-258035 TaxID=2981138 RepID=UPI0024BD4FAE|nr:bacteriophage holin [Crossiella sp. CA-258035]WHT16828.1 bacteriophage holin [Crossiella sp. CA-258035]